MADPSPAPDSTNTRCPATASSRTPAGVTATRYSLSLTSRGIPTITAASSPPGRIPAGPAGCYGGTTWEGRMERIRRGFRLLGASWEVLKADRELLVLPIVSFAIILVVTASVAGATWASGGLGREREALRAVDYVALGVFYFLSYFVSIFFNAAVVGAATIRLTGGDPSIGDGLRL